jgi:hypothetical protein
MRVDLGTRAGRNFDYNFYQAYLLFLSVAAYQERVLEPAVLSSS